jgi:replication factor A1
VSFEQVDVRLKLKDLIENLNDVKITASVREVSPVRTFVRDDGTDGTVANVRIYDDSGEQNVVLWNEKVEITTKLKPGQKIHITGAYTKKNNFDQIELVIGRKGKIKILS